MTGADYIGIATLISAAAAAVVTVINALQQRKTSTQVDEVHSAVSTPPGQPTLGIIAADTKEAVNGHSDVGAPSGGGS